MKLHRIADLYVGIDYKYETMKKQAPKYQSSDKPEMVEIVVWSSDQAIDALKTKQPTLTENDCEYLITGANFYDCLIDFDGLMIHSSAVIYNGEAFLFSADSGTGKSTHTQLWLKAFGDKAKILNDDKPAVRIINNEVYAYGTPWSGKTDWNENVKAPLKGICFIHRSDVNEIQRVEPGTIIQELLKQTLRPRDKSKMTKLLDNIDTLLQSVPVYTMGCNMDVEAAFVAYEAMK
ncbi:MAG: hypothetical protein IJ300_05885 [Clostridia bacterium]|nr:hypothetical protein [Clostridia bacterium]